MNGAFGNAMLNSTFFETDLDENIVNNSDLPFWLRDIIERAFTTSGIHVPRKVASKDAIALLTDVDLDELTDRNCTICYDPFDSAANKKKKRNPEDSGNSEPTLSRYDTLLANLSQLGPLPIEPEATKTQFSDPSLFMPVDEAAHHNLRFPQANLASREPVTETQLFPTIKSKAPVDTANCAHTPVLMPGCGHVFGRPCIIEWLNEHVSCPLCRKEVEAVRDDDPLSKKIAAIKENCNFVFLEKSDELIDHLAKHLTDVFNPRRKSFYPHVTPLTDTLVVQSWATPPGGDQTQLPHVADPPLVMTRKYPISNLAGQHAAPRLFTAMNAFPLSQAVATAFTNHPPTPTTQEN